MIRTVRPYPHAVFNGMHTFHFNGVNNKLAMTEFWATGRKILSHQQSEETHTYFLRY
jgi:hypothetical protein